jgi:hypothetical protein
VLTDLSIHVRLLAPYAFMVETGIAWYWCSLTQSMVWATNGHAV